MLWMNSVKRISGERQSININRREVGTSLAGGLTHPLIVAFRCATGVDLDMRNLNIVYRYVVGKIGWSCTLEAVVYVGRVAIHRSHRSCCKDLQNQITADAPRTRRPRKKHGRGTEYDVNAFQNMLSSGDQPEAHRLARSCDSSRRERA